MAYKKYLRQKDEYSCGPVSIMNYLIHEGLKVSYSRINSWRDIMGTTFADGTTAESIYDMLSLYSDVIIQKNNTIKHIKDLDCFIMEYMMSDGEMHYALVMKNSIKDDNIWIIANHYDDHNVPNAYHLEVNSATLNKFLKKKTTVIYIPTR